MNDVDMINTIVIHDATLRSWLLFKNPQKIYHISKIAEVIPALHAIEEQVMKYGFYAAGFISYEAAPAFDSSLVTRENDSFPLLWFGIYNKPEQFCFSEPTEFYQSKSLPWMTSLTREIYRKTIDKIKYYIERGDTYQVNFTFRMLSSFDGDPLEYFIELVKAQNTIYGAFVNTEKWAVCSASPELFFKYNGEELTSRPMKGTAPRGLLLSDDNRLAEWLYHSEKNRAENVMIVDMVRNDMGRIAQTGSVEVSSLFAVEKYPTVWQMTSTVMAKTSAGFCEILRALFPPASITGAPKSRTMQIIAELETTPRRIYTGSVGYLSPDRKAQFNVAIRTVLVDKIKRQAEYGVGGGIVWDSIDSSEFDECQTKAKILTERTPDFKLLETVLWTPEDGYFLLQYHLKRLMDSASYFSFFVDSNTVHEQLFSLITSFYGKPTKVRVLVAKDGHIICKSEALRLSDTAQPSHVCLAKSPVDSSNPFLYHKTTNRSVYHQALAACHDYEDVILWNEKGEITESCIANVLVEFDGEFYTPPVRCGLLPGTYRAFILEHGKVTERVIKKEELAKSSHIYLMNSVRKEWEVLVDSEEL